MKQGFDKRIVSYEYIHSIKSKDAKALIDAINPKPNQNILDAMCGYGAVGRDILKKEKAANLYFIDESKVQLDRAINSFPKVLKNRFKQANFINSKYPKDFFDAVVIKMGLHEVSKTLQVKVLKEAKRVLKPEGKLVIWDIMLNNKTQSMFKDVIRKKDELSGFKMLTTERYFFTEKEFKDSVVKAGFSKIKEAHTISYRFSSLKRLVSELHNDKKRLEKLNLFIRGRFPENLKTTLKYKDNKNDIQFNIVKKIYVLKK